MNTASSWDVSRPGMGGPPRSVSWARSVPAQQAADDFPVPERSTSMSSSIGRPPAAREEDDDDGEVVKREISEPMPLSASRARAPVPPGLLQRSNSVSVVRRSDPSFGRSLRRQGGSASSGLTHASSFRQHPAQPTISQLDKVAVLASYSPRIVIERFQHDASLPNCPTETLFYGAVVFVDISGFTALSEALSKQYDVKIGAEKLNEYINDYFRLLIDAIIDAGGDIIKFAGDALQVIWRVPDSSSGSSSGSRSGSSSSGSSRAAAASASAAASEPAGSTATAAAAAATASAASAAAAAASSDSGSRARVAEQVLHAARCCLGMLDNLHGFSPTPGVTLELHMGIGAGRLAGYTVGGHLSKW